MSAPDDAPRSVPKIPLAQGAVTHGCMLVTDITDDELIDGTFVFDYEEARKLL